MNITNFEFAEANKILSFNLPIVKVDRSESMWFSADTISSDSRTITKTSFEEMVQKRVNWCKQKLRNYETLKRDWEQRWGSLSDPEKLTAYEFLYWTEKRDTKLHKVAKTLPSYKAAGITVQHCCEVCSHSYLLIFNKQVTRYSKQACPACSHEPTEACMCAKCMENDGVLRANIEKLKSHIDAWLTAQKKIIMTIANMEGSAYDDIYEQLKCMVLENWSVIYSGKGYSSCSSDLSRYPVNSYGVRKLIRCSSRDCYDKVDASVLLKRCRKPVSYDLGCQEAPASTIVRNSISEVRSPLIKRTGLSRGPSRGTQIFVLTTSPNSNGYHDFCATVKGLVSFIPVFFDSKAFEGLSNCLATLGAKRGDAVVIVRGGGDIKHRSFNAFRSEEPAAMITALSTLGVDVIVGVGHANDSFEIDMAATISAITPTQAAIELLKLRGEKKSISEAQKISES